MCSAPLNRNFHAKTQSEFPYVSSVFGLQNSREGLCLKPELAC
jgi:hypothetical protein